MSSLGKMYGLIGESSHFDILKSEGRSVVIRFHKDDSEKFNNSLMAHTFKVNKYIELTGEVDCGIVINKCDENIGLVVTKAVIGI